MVEGCVVPVESTACFGGPDEQRKEDGTEQRLHLGGPHTRVGAREDRGGGLPTELFDRDPRILPRRERLGAGFDELPYERPILVQRGPAGRRVLLEGERELRLLALEHAERAQTEA